MAKPVTILKPKYFPGHTLFVLKVNRPGEHARYGGILVTGKHTKYESVNDVSIHVREFYNFTNIPGIVAKAAAVVEAKAKGTLEKRFPRGQSIIAGRS